MFDPKVSEDIRARGNSVSGTITHDYLLIPRRPGKFKIPPITFSYFDPDQETYVTERSDAFMVAISGEDGKVPEGSYKAPVAKEDLETLGEDIRYIKTGSPDFSRTDNSLFSGALGWALFFSPGLLFVLFVLARKRHQAMAGDTGAMKKRRASKVANKRLATAKSHMSAGKQKAFYDAVTKAIWGYLSDKLNLETAHLSREVVQQQLRSRQVSDDTIKELFALLDHAEMSLFAPSSAGDMDDTYATTEQVLANIETELKS